MTENYFNYFTEIEDHFQRARGTGLFLLSPLDWALIEAWKNAGIPLEAVLRGIDQAFDKWRSRPPRARLQMVNSLAYCAQAIAAEVQNAGKTGTAYIAIPGGYSTNRYFSIFGGVVPVSNPRLAAVIVIVDPSAGQHMGGDVAAPVFSAILGGALRLLAIPPDDVPSRPTDALLATPKMARR